MNETNLNGSKFGLHGLVPILLRLGRRRGGVEQKWMRGHLQPRTLLGHLGWTSLVLPGLGHRLEGHVEFTNRKRYDNWACHVRIILYSESAVGIFNQTFDLLVYGVDRWSGRARTRSRGGPTRHSRGMFHWHNRLDRYRRSEAQRRVLHGRQFCGNLSPLLGNESRTRKLEY